MVPEGTDQGNPVTKVREMSVPLAYVSPSVVPLEYFIGSSTHVLSEISRSFYDTIVYLHRGGFHSQPLH